MKRIFAAGFLSVIWVNTSFADDLKAKPLPVTIMSFQDISFIGNTQPKKPKRLITLDIPVFPFEQKTVHIRRIEDTSINRGSVLNPWSDSARSDYPPLLQFNFLTDKSAVVLSGGYSKIRDYQKLRSNKQLNVSLESSSWKILFGFESFINHEKVPNGVKGILVNRDFSRLSAGGRTWFGVKFGDFNGNFVSAKFAGGYIRTEGKTSFPGAGSELGSIKIYTEDFYTKSLIVEAVLRQKRFSQNLRIEGNQYQRILYSPDEKRYGSNRIEDLILKTGLEFIPSLRHQMVRFLVRGNKGFKKDDRLLFSNDWPDLQFLIRLAF